MPPVAPELHFVSRAALRAWLADNHASHPAIWLVYDKKPASGTWPLSYDDIVEEAICFGWIDSVVGKVDARRSKLYFSPRKPRSVWSALNKKRVAKLTELGIIMPAGQAKIDQAKADGSWAALDKVDALVVPDDLAQALAKNKAAKRHFDAFPPGARKIILTWIYAAKRPETRAKRVDESVRLAAQNIRANDPRRRD
jgi:uncharacterized protein YdeI (YjbR/CyaY-like superfamily)